MMDGVRVVRQITISDSIIQMQMVRFLLAGTSSGRSSCCSLIKAIDLHFMVLDQNKDVMQTDGFDYLKQSCPFVISELLEYVARISEHYVIYYDYGTDTILDGADMNGRRVKPRLY